MVCRGYTSTTAADAAAATVAAVTTTGVTPRKSDNTHDIFFWPSGKNNPGYKSNLN